MFALFFFVDFVELFGPTLTATYDQACRTSETFRTSRRPAVQFLPVLERPADWGIVVYNDSYRTRARGTSAKIIDQTQDKRRVLVQTSVFVCVNALRVNESKDE
jgi:hypothetical protein